MDKLRELEKTNKHLFHGSLSGEIEEFEPRQARSHGKDDGAPCVAASELVGPAIFMAVLGSRKLGGWNINKNREIVYYLLRSEFDKATTENWAGFVYVLDRDRTIFKVHQAWEWRAHTHVKPTQVIRVGMGDLPKNILLLDTYEQYISMSQAESL